MTVTIKVRKKGLVVIPKALRERAGIKEGSTVTATAFKDGVILSPKEVDVLGRLLGLAKVSGRAQTTSVKRIRTLREQIHKELRGQG